MNPDSTPILDHETALVHRIPNGDTLAAYELLTVAAPAWTVDTCKRGLGDSCTLSRALWRAQADGHPQAQGITLELVDWRGLELAVDRWMKGGR